MSNPTQAHVYVSSNTKDPSTDQDAAAGLSSPQFKLLRQMTPGGVDAVGRWSDGSEESRVTPFHDLDQAAHLGLTFKQKQVLIYEPGKGPDSRYVYKGLGRKLSPSQIRQVLKDNGLSEFHTLTDDGDVHIVNSAEFGTAAPPIPLLGIKPHVTQGRATFLGGADRDEGAAVFQRILNNGHGTTEGQAL